MELENPENHSHSSTQIHRSKFSTHTSPFFEHRISQTRMSDTRCDSRILPMFGYLFVHNRDHSHADCSGEHIAAGTMICQRNSIEMRLPLRRYVHTAHTLSAGTLQSTRFPDNMRCCCARRESCTLASFALSISISIQYHTGVMSL